MLEVNNLPVESLGRDCYNWNSWQRFKSSYGDLVDYTQRKVMAQIDVHFWNPEIWNLLRKIDMDKVILHFA